MDPNTSLEAIFAATEHMEAGTLTWKNEARKQKGELVLTKMRFQVESFQRQLASLAAEKELIQKRCDRQLAELQRRYENEILLQVRC